jgi:hypothetical protein
MTSESIALLSALIALASAAAAWGALLVHRRNATETVNAQVNIAARNSRATVVSANRQRWIDAIRDDIAEFIAARTRLVGAYAYDDKKEIISKLTMLRARVEMRLNPEEAEHLALLAAMDLFRGDPSSQNDKNLRTQAGGIFKAEWERLKKEATGINPLVR